MESILRKDCTRWWIDFIKEKKSYGLYHDNDCIAVACLKFCFMLILREMNERNDSVSSKVLYNVVI